MFFRSEKWISILLIALVLMGCGRYLTDKPKKDGPFELSLKGTQCLNDIPQVLEDYFQQKLVPPRLQGSIACMDAALVEFLNSTKGADATFYRTIEVQNFFEKYIFKRKISSALIHEIMKLKVAMIGGADQLISRAEFEKLRGFLRVLEVEMLRLYPHLNLFLLRESLLAIDFKKDNRLDWAIRDLKLSVKNLLANVQLANSDYSLPEIDLLLAEVERFAGLSDPQNAFSVWRKSLPTLEKIRVLLVGDQRDLRSQNELAEAWNLLIDAYRLGLEYEGEIKKRSITTPSDFLVFDAWIENLFSLLERSMKIGNRQYIPFKRIDDILDELYSRQLWMGGLKLETAKISYRKFLLRFFESSPVESLGLEIQQVLQIRREYLGFKLIQQAIERVFAEKQERPVTEVVSVLDLYPIQEEIKKLAPLSMRDQETLRRAWVEFSLIVKDTAVRQWTEAGKVSMGVNRWELWNYGVLTRINLWRSPTSLIMRAYGNAKKVGIEKSILTVPQIKAVLDEFLDFGGETKIFDLRNLDTSERSAHEADMFTPSGNGDNQVQFLELHDLLGIMWSGGMAGVTDFKRVAAQEGCLLANRDYFGEAYMQMDCSSQTFRRHFGQIFSQFPAFSHYVEGLSDQDWLRFYLDLLKVGRICPKDLTGLETSDQRTMVVILHYIENLFSIYDQNRNDRLDEQEVESSFPRFREFMIAVTKRRLQEVSPLSYKALNKVGYNWSGMALNVFKFIVFNGRVPSGGELLKYMAGDTLNMRGSLGEADRQAILKVFATLKAQIATGPVLCQNQPL